MTLPDRLAGTWVLDLHATPPTLAASFGPARPLVRLGPGLYRQQDRQHATLALGTDAAGRPQLHGFGITLEPLGPAAFAGPWAAALAGAAGLLWWVALPPWRRWRQGRSLRRAPAFWAVLMLVAALLRHRREGASRLGLALDTLAAGGLIALAALMAAYGRWPLAMWRV